MKATLLYELDLGDLTPLNVRYSPDGRWLAIGGKSASRIAQIGLWKRGHRECFRNAKYDKGKKIGEIEFLPNGDFVVFSYVLGDKSARLVSEPGLRTEQFLPLKNIKWTAAAIAARKRQEIFDKEYQDAVERNDQRAITKAALRRPDPDLPVETTVVSDFAFSPDGNVLAAPCWDLTVKIWNLRTRRPWFGKFHELRTHQKFNLDNAAFLDGGKMLLTGSAGELRPWNLADRKLHKAIRIRSSEALKHAASPDGRHLLSAGILGGIRLWNTRTWKYQRHQLDFCPGLVTDIAFLPDSSSAMIACAGAYGVAIWSLLEKKQIGRLKFGLPVGSVACAPDCREICVTTGRPSRALVFAVE